MRILIDLQSCQNGSRHRGIGRYTLNITKELLKIHGGHEFLLLLSDRFPDTIASLRDELAPYVSQDVFRVCSMPDQIGSAPSANAWRHRAAELVRTAFIAQCQPDVVFIPSFFEGLWESVVTSLDDGDYTVVATLHDLIPLENPDLYLPDQADRDAYIRMSHKARRLDRLIAISHYVARDAQARLAVPAERLRVVHNGVDDQFVPADLSAQSRAALMQRMGIAQAFIFNNSPLEGRKNLEGLIAGFAAMPSSCRDTHQLVVAGKLDVYARAYLKSLMAAAGLPEDRLIMPGYISDEDMIGLYSECALFAFPSHSEGFGLPPLEAMACGAPVVVSDTTSLPEVVDRRDLLVDPANPVALGAAMERIVSDPALRDELRRYALERAQQFPWEQSARKVMAELEACVAERRQARGEANTSQQPSAKRLAFVCLDASCTSHVAGRLSVVLDQLNDRFDLTLVTDTSLDVDSWLKAELTIRPVDWFECNSWQFSEVIYAGGDQSGDRLLDLMVLRPGLYLDIADIGDEGQVASPAGAVPLSAQRDMEAHGGLAALIDHVSEPSAGDGATLRPGERFRAAASQVLAEHRDGLPGLPLCADKKAAHRYRNVMQVDAGAPLIGVLVHHAATAADIRAKLRDLMSSHADAYGLFHSLEEDGNRPSSLGPLHPERHIRHLAGGIARHYRGLLSAIDVLVLGSDLPADVVDRCLRDAENVGIEVVRDGPSAAIAADIDTIVSWGNREKAAMATIDAPRISPEAAVWCAALEEQLTIAAPRRRSQVETVVSALSGAVRGQRPDSADVAQLSAALEKNEAYERDAAIFLDISAFASHGASRRIDPLTREQLFACLHRGGKGMQAVYAHGDHFCLANHYVSRELGLPSSHAPDAALSIRAGDKIVGLDLLYSFQPNAMKALGHARDYGAGILYLASGQTGFQHGSEQGLADILSAWIDGYAPSTVMQIVRTARPMASSQLNHALKRAIQDLTLAHIPAAILALDDIQEDTVEDLPAGSYHAVAASADLEQAVKAGMELRTSPKHDASRLHYTVMGHLLGSYSLAIVNRSVAQTLERAYGERVHYAPFETDPIRHTEGVPAAQKALMIALMERPRPNPQNEIMICQHWPIIVPRVKPRLALSLFHWEESHVPKGMVETLSDGFDAILSPTRSVTDALTVSGCAIPAATIGLPVDLAPFHEIGRKRQGARPIRKFVHISSAFPRKGVDLLLEAWGRAFTASDDVELTIKTFPNPHNDVEAQLERLKQAYPALAPVNIVNRDVEPEELRSFYRDYDALVLPTRGEGYNLPALEAMAAGVPLIVTGHGGQRDFCGPDHARMIKFRFSPSASHIAGSHSLWLEPDVDDLAHALRELHDPANAETIEQRRCQAMRTALEQGDTSAWLKRFNGVVQDLLTTQWQGVARVGWVSSWRVQCGIAQYSGYLLDRMTPAQRASTTIYCDRRTAPSPDEGRLPFKPVWNLIGDKATDIVETAIADGVEALVIQHQDGLISWEQLGQIGHHPALGNIVSVVILHNVRNLLRAGDDEVAHVIRGLSKLSRVLVHNVGDMNFLLEHGLRHNLGLFPHGAFSAKTAPWPRELGVSDAPIVGCHGFFFRHKGIDKLIRAAAQLRREWPGLRLRLVNARFPGDEHDHVIQECQRIAVEVGMEDAIEWHLDFLPVQEIEALLGGCDAIVLPYEESDDSASGAIRTCLSTMVPLIATRVKIFAEMDNVVARAESNDPDALADAIRDLFRSSRLRREVQAATHNWLQAHDWTRMAMVLENMVNGIVYERRLGWKNHQEE